MQSDANLEMATREKRSRPVPTGNLTRLVQTHVTPGVGDALTHKAGAKGMSEAAYVRWVVMRDLGFYKED